MSVALAGILLLAACNRRGHRVLDVAYVSAVQASLRDQVAAVYNRVGTVKNGERVEVLDRDRRFARVRTATGLEGWIEQRYLVDQKIYNGLQKLTQDHKDDPMQAPGVLRNDTNLHITPGRDSEHLYQLASGAKVSLLTRATTEKESAAALAPVAKPGRSKASSAGPVLEDWWLVRDSQGRVGWVLSRMVDVDVPLDIAQYAEGQRFVAFFVLNEVEDAGISAKNTDKDRDKKDKRAGHEAVDNSGASTGRKSVPQYLCILTEPRDGLPYDYDQVRVFTWNVKRHRYETAYREHGLNGVLPVKVAREDFDKEGTLPVFVLQVKDDSGNVTDRKYKLNTPIVRRVLAPGEQKETPRSSRKRRS
jgi:hypothetical protein